METNKTNLKAVKELVLDEHKLVTYISLSKDLCIHVNEAKSLLCDLVQDTRKSHPETDLSVSYVISGLLNDNNGCVTVCSEKDLESHKKTLKIIFYEHVYCVSRGPKPIDKLTLTTINNFEDLTLCTGLIKANSCSKRTDNEIGDLKSKNHAVLSITKSTSVPQKPKEKVKELKQEVKSVSDSKLNINIKSEVTSPKKDTSNNNQRKVKTPTKGSGNKTAAKSIAGFFSKVNGDSSKAKKAKVQEQDPKVDKSAIKVEKDQVEPKSSDTIISPGETNTTSKQKNTKTKANNNKALTQIKKNAKVDKKRKRLLHVSDSESETEDNDPFNSNEMDIDQESEDEIPPTPTINTVKITSGIVNPKKRRKIVDKTYTDEDGYILTKKEEVYESCSENEEDVKENGKDKKENGKQEKENVKQEKENGEQEKENTQQLELFKNNARSPKANKGKKISPPKKGNQPTISNFFKKI